MKRPDADYIQKPPSYFAHANLIVASNVQGHNLHIFDVGCGQGALLRVLRDRRLVGTSYGVELEARAADEAREVATEVWNESIESFDPPIENASLDYVICADVLEHLRDPASVLIRLKRLMKGTGRLLVSLPNVSNRRVIWDLVANNEWRYAQSGVMDATHLRWFTRKSAIRLLGNAGFTVLHSEYVFWGRGGSLMKTISFGTLSRFFAAQLFFVASPEP